MPYDEGLAHRVRELVVDELDVTEKRMFGGLAFLVNGHMSVTISRRGGIMARLDPQDAEPMLAQPDISPFVSRGRVMPGWLCVDDARLDSDDGLRWWVEQSLDFARTLPAKF